ncbi:MAG: ATPase [Planctomycetaceae bacterium]|nr:MAG: ATPase [Planctomycetaceae bacterium]
MPFQASRAAVDRTPVKLAVLVECVIFPLLREHPAPIHFDLAVPIDLMTTADPELLSDLLKSLVRGSLKPMSDGGELTVTAVHSVQGIELEIADSVGGVEDRELPVSLAAAGLGCKPHWQNCPQGGVAVTITLPDANPIASTRKAA